MKISYNTLKKIIHFDLNPSQVSAILTDTGLEVESVEKFESIKGGLNGIVIGEVLNVEQHPNADKLKITQVKISENEILKIVCGAPNVEQGQKVAVATIGTELFINDKSLIINKSKIRGEESFGMLCSEVELNLGSDSSGIKIFDDKIPVGTLLKNIYNIKEDYIFEIGLTPNRSDAMSHIGVARDLYASLKFKKNATQLIENESFDFPEELKESSFNISIENEDLCNRYSGIYLTDINIYESPNWIKNFLKSIDIEPKNNVVDITNYVLHYLGQPLHAFDANKIKDKSLKIGTCIENIKFTSLDSKERTLNGTELIIKDTDDNPLCIAGIIGGKDSAVSNDTNSIFLESAYFNPVSVRKSAKLHQINTDSSFRFERGCDPNMTIKAIELATELLCEYANAKITEKIIDIYPNPIKNNIFILRYSKVDQILGHKIHREEIKKILNLLEIEILSDYNDNIEISIPPFRNDVTREIDVIEEILRIYGYNAIDLPQKIEFSRIQTQKNESLEIENKISNILVYNGFFECLNNSLVPLKENVENKVTLLNPLSNDLAMMRTNLLEGLLENALFNINRKQNSIKLFEFGNIYHKYNEKFQEDKIISILLCGNSNQENWITKTSEFSFFELKGNVVQILKSLGIYNFNEEFLINHDYFSEGISIKINKDIIAELGFINKNITKNKDINKQVLFANFNIQNLIKYKNSISKIREISKFPTSKRDLALLIDLKINYQDIKKSALNTEKKILKDIELFDVYEGDKIPQGKKSYAISFYLQDEDKTLTENQIENSMKKLIDKFKSEFNAELRN